MSTRHAFTLIELLIVVAIIAILAAIAVPNFLEAQVRSKVSRTKADMRTIVTGLEAYAVDFNRYPYGDGQGDGIALDTFPVARPGIWRLTTPIAYLSSVPQDVFAPPTYVAPAPGGFLQPYTPNYFFVCSRPEGFGGLPRRTVVQTQETYRYLVQDLRVNRLRPGFVPPPITLTVAPGQTENVTWELRSMGADRTQSYATPYDPTNGTISAGDLALFGPGNVGLGF